MKSILFLCVVLSSFVFCQSNENSDYNNLCKKDFSVSYKPSYFCPQDHVFRDVYGGGYISLFELSYHLYKGMNIWLESGYFDKSGEVKSFNISSLTYINQIPISLGAGYTYKIYSWIDIYFKLAPNWVYTKTWVDIPNLKKTVIKNTFGLTFGSGLKLNVSDDWSIELFINYLYDKGNINDRDSGETFNVYLGGIQTGAGLVYKF